MVEETRVPAAVEEAGVMREKPLRSFSLSVWASLYAQERMRPRGDRTIRGISVMRKCPVLWQTTAEQKQRAVL